MPIEKYVVTINRPHDCSVDIAKTYICEAVKSYKGWMPLDYEERGIEIKNVVKQKELAT
jgi:hypothetical protein